MSAITAEWKHYPIPPCDAHRARLKESRAIPIDPASPQGREPLICAETYGLAGRNHYAHSANPPYYAQAPGAVDALYLRESVAARLALVNEIVGEAGLELFLFDAWRPRAVQEYFYSVWTPAELKKRQPDLEGEALEAEVSRYWSKPTQNPAAPAPHATGGAVDLTLRFKSGDHVFMGSLFDDPSEISHRDALEGAMGSQSLSAEEARANRRVLHWAMSRAGFAGHPNEWWHFSYGDQMWARLSGAPRAFYGLAAPDAGE